MFARVLAVGLALVSVAGRAAAEPPRPPNIPARSWSRAAADRWASRAQALAQRGDTMAAITAYTEAIRLDPSFGAAYLGLSELRALVGDPREAEWLLTRATALAEVRAEALARRARLYRTLGRAALALADLENAARVEPSPRRLRELAALYVEHRAWVAALAVWRKLHATLDDTSSSDERREIDDTIAALSLLAAEADAVGHDTGERHWVLRALRRGGSNLERVTPR